MKKLIEKPLLFLFAFVLAFSLFSPSFAADKTALDKAALDKVINDTAAYMVKTVQNPQVNSVGGEWAVIGLARSNYAVPDSYYQNYYRRVERYVEEHKGVLHEVKYTEYSRVILGLTASGYDPRRVGGYDLTLPLGDYGKTVWQGINGPIFALIALDSLNYAIPANKDAEIQATRDLYIAEILRRQTPDGGWNLTAGSQSAAGALEKSEADLTGMALQALAKYQDRPAVKSTIEKALAFLSEIQDSKGGYGSSFSNGSSAVESAAQVVTALCELGIPIDDSRFVKNGCTLVDNILSFQNADSSFNRMAGGGVNNQMSTEQAFYGLVAVQRVQDGKNSLYRMTDTVHRGEASNAGNVGLPGKHTDVAYMPVTVPGKTFSDVADSASRTAIEALAARGIISGRSEASFVPDATMTRAEFTVIITRALGLPEKAVNIFEDVPASAWYVRPVAAATFYEIVSGTSKTTFNPNGTITRQEAAVMLSQAAKLCGMETAQTEVGIRDTLAQFGDYRKAADWAQSSLAFCLSEGIWDESDFSLNIEPGKAITRGEIAEMLYRMMDKANLL